MSINLEKLSVVTSKIKQNKNSKLLIVTKNRSISDIEQLIKLGFRTFGENRLQEARNKFSNIDQLQILELHMIGPLQTNKVKEALKVFSVIQSVDRKKLIDEIAKTLKSKTAIKTKEYYLQVNIGGELQKAGADKKNIYELYQYSILNGLNIVGLMCIPPNISNPSNYFKEMLTIRDSIDVNLKLSMGMSGDYEYALKFKSNLIRIGSLFFN